MHFKGKLINQTWKNCNFGPDFGSFWPKFGPQIFCVGLTSTRCYTLLQAIIYAISRTTDESNLRIWQKTQFWAYLCPVWPKFGSAFFFCKFYHYYMLDIVASYHCMQQQRKLMNQTWENNKKPSFGPDFGPFGPNLVSNFFMCVWFYLN